MARGRKGEVMGWLDGEAIDPSQCVNAKLLIVTS